jgi:Ca-activated chloride channel family protein
MRQPVLSLGLVALLVGACGTANYAQSTGPYVATPPPQHHGATQAPEQPPATPYDGVTYEDPGVNPFVDPNEDRESTFGLDVDTASYTVARRYITDGNLPDPASVRVEEFVNYFDQGYAAPEDDTFAIHVDGGPSPFLAQDEVLLRIGLKARDVADRVRPVATLTFVIDVSGSMAREDRLGLVKQSLALLVEGLRRDDRVGIVVYGSDARVVLPPTSARDAGTILDAIDSLEPEGSTNAQAGLRLGYEMARAQLRDEGINRVVLASDGVANVGATDAETILRDIRHDAEAGIQLVSIGFGMGNFNDALLEQLADQGDGFYAYVDDLDEARRLFVEDLTGTLQSVALDARVQVEFSSDAVEAYRLVGFENRAIDDNQFRDDAVEAGAIGAGHSVTALYVLRLSGEGGSQGRVGTIGLRWSDPVSRRTNELAHDVRLSDIVGSFRASGPTFKLDAVVAATAERFRDSRWGETYDLDDVARVADQVSGDLPQTQEVHDFLELLRRAADLER